MEEDLVSAMEKEPGYSNRHCVVELSTTRPAPGYKLDYTKRIEWDAELGLAVTQSFTPVAIIIQQ